MSRLRWPPVLSVLDARVLRATDPLCERTVERVAQLAGCSDDVAHGCLRRLRGRMLVEPDGAVRPGGCVLVRAMSRWSISREPKRCRIEGLVSESLTG